MARPSPTAGGPPGTTFSGPLRVVRGGHDDATLGFPICAVIGPWCKPNMPANTSALTSLADLAAVTGWVAPYPGSIIGVSMSRSTVNTAGQWGVRVKKNDVLLFNTSNVTARSVEFFQSNLESFTYTTGDRVTLKIVTNSAYSAATGDFAGFIHIA